MKVRSVGCFLEHLGEILIIYRTSGKADGNSWAIPAGKINEGEYQVQAIIREIFEETGYKASERELELLGTYKYSWPEFELEFTAYRLKLQNKVSIRLNQREHSKFMWAKPDEVYEMDSLIRGFRQLLELTGYVKREYF